MKNQGIKSTRLRVWESSNYYQAAKVGSLNINHFGMRLLKKYAKMANTILDLGCGEGSRLNYIAGNKDGYGIDISRKGIKLARKSYPHIKFIVGNLESLPFSDRKFDLIYSAYVLEHLENPEKVIKEAIRVLKKDGLLILIAPNYGSPNRASPVYSGSRLKKIVTGFKKTLTKSDSSSLEWDRVRPVENPKLYTMDLDTQVEPYLGSLLSFLKNNNCKILNYSSCWEEELPNAKLHQKIFKILSGLGVYPFTLWGPHLVVVVKKFT